MFHVLVGRRPVPADLVTWAEFYEDPDRRRVALDAAGGAEVSTVFLGLDHSHRLGRAPVLFETMVFGGPLDGETERYCTWEEAVAGHAAMLARVADTVDPRIVAREGDRSGPDPR